jgi:hypothetical protein
MEQTNTIIVQHSSNPADPDGSQRRYAIIHRNKELLEHHASQHPHDDLAYILIDLSREGKEIPKQLNDQSLATFVLQSDANEVIPTQIVGLPRWEAYKALRTIQRSLHRADPFHPLVSPVVEKLKEQPPPSHFPVLVISGGKQAAILPIP